MFNLSLQCSKMPEEWKIGEIPAIFKKGNQRSPMNYRPVSLTSIVYKLLESLVREEMISHMRSNKLFSPYQYGFIDKRSTTLQLLYVVDKWTEIIDDGGTIDAIYMDFMKAFDKVPHERLLKKVMDTSDKRNTTGLSPGAYFICLVHQRPPGLHWKQFNSSYVRRWYKTVCQNWYI